TGTLTVKFPTVGWEVFPKFMAISLACSYLTSGSSQSPQRLISLSVLERPEYNSVICKPQHLLPWLLLQSFVDKIVNKGSGIPPWDYPGNDIVECKNVDSKEKMAVKIVERNLSAAAVKEVSILKNLRQLDENKNNLVRFVEHFQQKGCSCLVFEILDMSLYDFLKKRSFNPLRVSEMRVIAQQMLVALNALKSIGLIHGDIKPDNIMLVNHTAQPFKIKLIDFGLAHSASKITAGTKIQAVGYRAPEVMLGCPMNEAIDMWSLGCVLAFMYLGRHLKINLFCKLFCAELADTRWTLVLQKCLQVVLVLRPGLKTVISSCHSSCNSTTEADSYY
uniref:Protein kinase domain-containing protein n=1 Tax=Mola mola TaxID=94237 RepID=A0A3Q3W3V0_MOLML